MGRDEFPTVRAVAVDAFGGSNSIGDLLDALHQSWAWDDSLSFVAEQRDEIVGQVLFTRAMLDAPERLIDVLVLSPIGVRRDQQRSAIGTALMTASLATLDAQRGEPVVFLEGHPSYYPRFGFVPASPEGFRSPSLRIPDNAFMMRRLPSFEPGTTGTLVYPDAFWRTDSVGLREHA
jgi:putative acetyltransferase